MTITVLDRDEGYKKEVVKRLESLLARARKGEIRSIVYAYDGTNDDVTHGSTRIKDRYVMLGYLSYMMFRLSQSLDEDATIHIERE